MGVSIISGGYIFEYLLLGETVKKKLSYKHSNLRLPRVSHADREICLVTAAGKLNISKGVALTLTEMNKVITS